MESLAAYSLLDLQNSSSPSLSSTSTSTSSTLSTSSSTTPSPCSIGSIHPCNVKHSVVDDNKITANQIKWKWNELGKDRCEDITMRCDTKTSAMYQSSDCDSHPQIHQPIYHPSSQIMVKQEQQEYEQTTMNEDGMKPSAVNDGNHASTITHHVIPLKDIKCSKCDTSELSDDNQLSKRMQSAWNSICDRYKDRISDNDNDDNDPTFLTCKHNECGKCFALCKKDGCYKLLLLKDVDGVTSSTFRNYVQHVEKMHRKREKHNNDVDYLNDSQENPKRRKGASNNINKSDVFINQSIGTSNAEHQTRANFIPIMALLQNIPIPVTNVRYSIENASESFAKLNNVKDQEGFVAIWVKGRVDIATVWEVSRVGLLKMNVLNSGSFELENQDAILDLQTGSSCSLLHFTMMDAIPQLTSVVIDCCKTSECMNPNQFSYLTKITKEITQEQPQNQDKQTSDNAVNQQEMLSLTPRERKTSEFLAKLRLQSNASV